MSLKKDKHYMRSRPDGWKAAWCLAMTLGYGAPALATVATGQVPTGQTAPVAARSADADDAAGWRFAVTPYLWMPALQGNGALDGESGRFTLPFHKAMHNLDFFTLGEVSVSHGPYSAFLDVQYLDVSKRMTFAMPGVSADASMRSTQVSLGGSYQAYAQALGDDTVFGAPQQLTIASMAGVHWTRLNARAWGEGHALGKSTDWAIPFVGVNVGYDLDPHWTLTAEGDVGAWGRDWGLQGQAYLGYRLGLLGQESLLRVGYRVIHQDHQTDALHWNVTQYGPAAGLTVWF
ncbi:hypothetical protein [Serratia marcescens]|uniref:hypothetical protein n=1 Tax=Serratia marcescens TaxID=615 RepID=UPI001F1B4570|nr:hypothetical protein [Serratia marcescens]UIM56145.1 hypothetical protein LXH15_03180 [Serratia marcescens]